jgi:hypothetical protein
MPIFASIALLSFETVSAFIHINNRTAFRLLILAQLRCKFNSFGRICFGVKTIFFIADTQTTQYGSSVRQNVLHVRADNCRGALLLAFTELACQF